jgi:hypothetical protein
MPIPVNGAVAGPSGLSFSAVQEAIKAGLYADLANIIDTLELEVCETLSLSLSLLCVTGGGAFLAEFSRCCGLSSL